MTKQAKHQPKDQNQGSKHQGGAGESMRSQVAGKNRSHDDNDDRNSRMTAGSGSKPGPSTGSRRQDDGG